MKIPAEKFYDFAIDTKIARWNALSLVRKHFCGPMNVHGLCTEECDNCVFLIMSAFDFTSQEKNPSGLIIWKLKDAVAQAKEVAQSEKPKASNYVGNPFEAFL